MPKKHKQKSLLTKPTSSAPSNLLLTKTSASQDVLTKKTVNELLRESRQSTGIERPQNVQHASSIPPSLRAVLNLPAPPPPTPRYGCRGPTRLRRIPGPPPPRSWLSDSRHAPPEARNIAWSTAHLRTRVQKQSSNLPEGRFPHATSLQHAVFKNMATNWSWHAQFDEEYLPDLPVVLKQTLLSYLAIYHEGFVSSPLRLLFPARMTQVEDDTVEVRRLDLGNALGSWTTLRKIEKELEADMTTKPSKQNASTLRNVDVPDTWDEDGIDEQSLVAIPKSVSNTRFCNLKHLSLAVAPGTTGLVASWSALLALVSRLSTLHSLSLAYWPQPTYTPNASLGMNKVASASNVSTPVVYYGGTNFYTAYDNDWREAAGILRTLSRSLYCLKWLDLTGCGDWLKALTWMPSEDEQIEHHAIGPDWNGSWRELEHLVLAVGWSPAPLIPQQAHATLESSPTDDTIPRPNSSTSGSENRIDSLLSQLTTTRLGGPVPLETTPPETWDVEGEREKYYHRMEVQRHRQMSQCARQVAQDVRAIRRESGGKWIDVDLGPNEEPEKN